jgi:arginyl-tRNA synthetase
MGSMIEDRIKDEIQAAVSLLYKKHLKTADIRMEKPSKREHGDYSSNFSFGLGKELSKNPADIASEVASAITKIGVFESVSSAGGFVNFKLKKDEIVGKVREILEAGRGFGKRDLLKGKKIQVEFISANPTGPLTMANGRGGFGGDVIARLFEYLGANVEREYYVNDGGNQVRILGDSILVSAGKLPEKDDIYKGEYIKSWVIKNPELITKYQDDPFLLGQLAAKDILKNHIKPAADKMKIKYNNWFSEKELISSGEVEEAISWLKDKGHTKNEDGALWFCSTKFGDDKDRVLVKADGEKTYFANDIAYHFDKFDKRKFDKVIDIWGADHHGYIGRMQAAVSAMGFSGSLDILITQMVRLIKDGKEYKMSKRKGVVVTVDDLLDLISSDTRVASDVARFFFLSRSFNTHMDFDLDLAREQSDKNPVYYVKYAHARVYGILEKAGTFTPNREADLNLLGEPSEIELIETISTLPQVSASILAMSDYPVHLLTYFVRDVASKFHAFYDKCKVIDPTNPALTEARIQLVLATKMVLEIALEDLLGIEAPNKM